MDIGICIASHIGDIGYVERAEALGYSHAWFADSQMLWSDCYATLALAATRTSRIKLGTGVAITGTRPASVNAAGIATINALAPGRTFFGVGAGNTAMRVMGKPPHRIREFDHYLRTLKPLLRGEEAVNDDGQPIVHIMPDTGFVNFEDPIPLYVSGFGPRSLGLAGEHGDGSVISGRGSGAALQRVWDMIESGAAEAGREIDRDAYYMTALTRTPRVSTQRRSPTFPGTAGATTSHWTAARRSNWPSVATSVEPDWSWRSRSRRTTPTRCSPASPTMTARPSGRGPAARSPPTGAAPSTTAAYGPSRLMPTTISRMHGARFRRTSAPGSVRRRWNLPGCGSPATTATPRPPPKSTTRPSPSTTACRTPTLTTRRLSGACTPEPITRRADGQR